MNAFKHTGRVLLAVAVVVILAAIGIVRRCTATGFGHGDDRPGADTLAVAIEMSPLTYTFAADTAAGFDYEILRAIGREHKLAIDFHPVASLQDAFMGLDRGRYDLLVASLPSTTRLQDYFPVTEPIYLDRVVLAQHADSAGQVAVASVRDLIGDTVYIAEGSPIQLRLNNLCHELGDTIYTPTLTGHTSEHLALMVASGDIGCAAIPEAVGRRIADDNPGLDLSLPLSTTHFQVWAVAPGDSALLDSLNRWLGDFKNTSAYHRLAETYLSN